MMEAIPLVAANNIYLLNCHQAPGDINAPPSCVFRRAKLTPLAG